MANWNNLQQRILALLEEAGEEDLASLTNSVRAVSPHDLSAWSDALKGLLLAALIDFGSRSKFEHHWKKLSQDGSIELLSHLSESLQWSSEERIWKWLPEIRAGVLLTETGLHAAHQSLSTHGWPT